MVTTTITETARKDSAAPFGGSMVALVTPFLTGGEQAVDYPALGKLIDWHIESGTQGIVLLGTTGEAASLTPDEYFAVVDYGVERAAGRIPVIVGTGGIATNKVVALSKELAGRGIAGSLVVTPYYCRPTQEGLYAHFVAVADSASHPVILYNVPSRTAVDLSPEITARLAEHEQIVAIKDATGDLVRAQALREQCGDKLALLSGDDATSLRFLEKGGSGVISVTANLFPEALSQLCSRAADSDWKRASALNHALTKINTELFCQSNPIPVKFLLARLGLCEQSIRLPLTWLDETYHKQLAQTFESTTLQIQELSN